MRETGTRGQNVSFCWFLVRRTTRAPPLILPQPPQRTMRVPVSRRVTRSSGPLLFALSGGRSETPVLSVMCVRVTSVVCVGMSEREESGVCGPVECEWRRLLPCAGSRSFFWSGPTRPKKTAHDPFLSRNASGVRARPPRAQLGPRAFGSLQPHPPWRGCPPKLCCEGPTGSSLPPGGLARSGEETKLKTENIVLFLFDARDLIGVVRVNVAGRDRCCCARHQVGCASCAFKSFE